MADYVAAKAKDADAELDFSHDHWNNADVRGALYAMQGWVCAYCGNYLPENDRGDVDHFRPKAPAKNGQHKGYWWLTFWFENYLLVCSMCNRTIKRSGFPLEPGGTHVEYALRATLDTEPRLLMDPTTDQPDRWFRVDWRDPTCPIVLSTSSAGHPSMPRRVAETIEFFRLNERFRLLQARRRALDEAMELYEQVESSGDRAKLERLRRMACRHTPSGLTVRSFLEDLAPEISLPSAHEELGWLLEEVDDLLNTAAASIDRWKGEKAPEREVEELCWLLAVLWIDPPAGAPADIERWLDEKRWRPMVEPRVHELRAAALRAAPAASVAKAP